MPKPKLFLIPKELPQRLRVPNNLPIETLHLVGREMEVEAACRLLTEPHVRLLTLVGPGGVGKTSLALRIAAKSLEVFEDGVYFVELAAIVDTNLVLPTIATTLQVREEPSAPLLSTLKTHLHDKKVLLVLDNFEQVIQAGAALSEILTACHNLTLLVTSRTHLKMRNERVFAVSPLATPTRDIQTFKRY